MKKALGNFVKYFILTLLTISSGLLLYYIYKLNILDLKYLLILCLIISFIYLLIAFKLIRKKTRLFSRIIFALFACILTVVFTFGIKYIQNTIHFVKHVTNVIQYETQNYSVLVLNDSSYNSMDDLLEKNIGFLTLNNNLEDIHNKLEKVSNVKFLSKEFNDISKLIESITNKEVDAIVLEESFVESLDESDYHLADKVKSIFTFELKVKKEKTTVKVDSTKDPFILYISGSDSRSSIVHATRSDVNILAVVNPTKHKVLLVSIPRDTYVQLHNTTGIKDKLTHAGIYGVEMSKNTIEDLLNIDINYYTKVSFNTVINVVDVIGGLDIDSEKAFRSTTDKSCRFRQGINHVTGRCALAYSRERFSYATGDIHRGQNQQQVLSLVINKLSDINYLTKYNEILESIDGSFETDMTYDELTNMVKYQLSNPSSWDIESIGISGEFTSNPTYSLGSKPLCVMIVDEKSLSDTQLKINEYLEK